MDARRLVTGCSGHLLKPMAGRHVFIIECNGQFLSRSSITRDIMPPHIQSGTSISSKFIGLTTTSNSQVEDERLIAPINSLSISSRRLSKVDVYLVQLLTFIGHLYLSGYVVWRGLKNGYQKDTCLKEIGLCALNMTTILSSIVNTTGRPIRRIYEHKIFTLIMNKIFIWAPKIMRKAAATST